MADHNAKLSLPSFFDIVQVMATEFLSKYEFDNISVKRKYNCAWVISKALAKIFRMPNWDEKVICETYFIQISGVKVCIETKMITENNEVLAIAHDEFCVIDLEKRRICRLKDIHFEGFEVYDPYLNYEFSSIDISMSSDESNNHVHVNYCDIDFSLHTNNVSYVRYIINDLGYNFIKENTIDLFEIHYLKESRIGDELLVHGKIDEGLSTYHIDKSGVTICKALIHFQKNNEL